ncbi:hypothetical protein IAR50_005443 [Cryptococcus sp. DSM 104548]
MRCSLLATLPFAAVAIAHARETALPCKAHSTRHDDVTEPETRSDLLIQKMLGDTALSRSVTRSGCHANIAASLPSACSSNEGRYLSEADKRNIAISFTVCSMRSALQAIPAECSMWWYQEESTGSGSDDYRVWHWLDEKEVVADQQHLCLSALHRSPQDWTSYNGFLSDASQLCYALRAEHDNKLVRQLYVNATLGQISLLEKLDLREEAQEKRGAVLEAVIIEQQTKFEHTSSVMHTTTETIQQHLLQYEHLSDYLHSSISDIHQGKDDLLDSLRWAIRKQTESATSFVEAHISRIEDQVRVQLSAQLDAIVNKHGSNLQSQYNEAGDMMLAIQEDVHHRTMTLAEQQASHYEAMESSWSALLQFVGQVEGGLQTLSSNVRAIEDALGHSFQVAVKTNALLDDNAANLFLSHQMLEKLATELNRAGEKVVSMEEAFEARIRTRASTLRWGWWRLSLFSGPSVFSINEDWNWVMNFAMRALIILFELSWRLVCYFLSAVCCLLVIPRTSLRTPFARIIDGATTKSRLEDDAEITIGMPVTPIRLPVSTGSLPPSYKSVYSDYASDRPRIVLAPLDQRAASRPRTIEYQWKERGGRARSAPL